MSRRPFAWEVTANLTLLSLVAIAVGSATKTDIQKQVDRSAVSDEQRILANIDVSRVQAQLEKLALLSDADPPAVTRILFTARDIEARKFLKEIIKDAGLEYRVDPVGNIFARYSPMNGTDGLNNFVGTGSHYDAIPFSGKYDGTVGVLGGIEALRALRVSKYKAIKPLEVVAFTSEEPTRFGVSCIGSRLLVGQMGKSDVNKLTDKGGIGFDQARRSAWCTGNVDDVALPENYYSAFVELHIEQGKVLEETGNDIGVVTAIAGPASGDAFFEGPGGHAGGVLMKDRHDAVLAGAEFALAVENVALNTNSVHSVATSGVFTVEPGAENSIGRRVGVSVDVRDIDKDRRNGMVEALKQKAESIGQERDVLATFNLRTSDDPAKCDDSIVETVRRVVANQKYKHIDLVSRAYHDSLLMARKFPTGMIFIPCRGGVSHHWAEFSSQEQIGKGIATLALTLAELAGKASDTDRDEL